MTHYKVAINSHLSAMKAFAYMAAFENAQEWDPGVVEATRIGDEPLGLGSRFKVVTETNGRQIPLDYTITEYEEGTRFVVTAQSSSIRSVDEVVVTSTETGCVVTYNAGLSFRGLFVLGTPLLPFLFRRIGDRAAAGLRRVLNPVDPDLAGLQ